MDTDVTYVFVKFLFVAKFSVSNAFFKIYMNIIRLFVYICVGTSALMNIIHKTHMVLLLFPW